MKADRSIQDGKPYGRARHTGGGCLMVFDFYATKGAAEQGISDALIRLQKEPGPLPKQFIVYLPSLDSGEFYMES